MDKSSLPQHIHLVGIGGDGMSSLAGILLGCGHLLTGSEKNQSLTKQKFLLKLFKKEGIKIFYGHRASNLLPQTELVIRSSAIPLDNPEIIEAKRRKISIWKRSEALGDLMKNKFGIAITGGAGKSTTTAMVGKILEITGLDPTVYLGAIVPDWETNFRVGKGKYFVCEADEYERSFLNLHFQIAVITNFYWGDHTDYYLSPHEEKIAFTQFILYLKK